MKKKIFYSTIKLRDFTINASYNLCDLKDYRQCCKEKKCLDRLCGNDEDKAFGEFALQFSEEQRKQEDEIRKQWFKECKLVEFIIQRPENGLSQRTR